MDELRKKLLEMRNNLSTAGGEITEGDAGSRVSNALISDGKASVHKLLNPDPLRDELIRKRDALSDYKIIATTDDGEIYETPNGTRGFKGKSFSTTDPEQVSRLLEGAKPSEVSRSGFNRDIINEHPVAARATKFVEGVPFVGSYIDEAVGSVLGEDAESAVRATSQAMDEERPKESLGLNIVGGITGGGMIGTAALPTVAAVAPAGVGMKAVTAAGVGVIAGATEGAMHGYGRAEGEGKTEEAIRLKNATEGSVMGGALGGVFGVTASAGGDALKGFIRKFKKVDVKTIASEFDLSSPAAKAVKAALDGEDLESAVKVLKSLGDEAMLADAGPAAGAMLDAVAQTGGKALRTARDAVEERINRMSPKMTTAFNMAFGAPKSTRDAVKEIAQESSSFRKKAYEEAFSQPINYASSKGSAIESVLDRIPEKTLRSAVQEANEAMQAAGIKNQQILAELAEDGAVTFKEMPNVRQLDEIKKGLQSIAQSETNDLTGKISGKGLRANKLARSLKFAMEDSVPAYKRALKLGGDKISEEVSFGIGQRLFQQNTTLEDVSQIMSDATPATRKAAKEGIRNGIEQTLSQVRRTITDPNVDGREALTAIKLFSSRANRDKLTLVVGKENARRVLNSVDETAQALELKAMVATNSKTAARQALQGSVDELTRPNALKQGLGGEFGTSTKQVIQFLTGETAELTQQRKSEVFAEIAEVLTERKGEDAERGITLVKAAMEGQPLKDEEAHMIASMIANPLALATDQSARQSLRPQ